MQEAGGGKGGDRLSLLGAKEGGATRYRVDPIVRLAGFIIGYHLMWISVTVPILPQVEDHSGHGKIDSGT